MSNDDERRIPFHRRRTKPLPRTELAPTASSSTIDDEPPDTRPAPEETKVRARATEEEAETMSRCPLCRQGMVSPEVAATFEAMIRNERDRE